MRGGLRRVLEEPIRSFWSGSHGPGRIALTAVTAPLAGLFGGLVRARNLAFDTGLVPSERGPIPVVSVGNLAVGGTGKTPVARWIVDLLLDRGRRPALVTRGYGEDELLLHRRWHPEVPVVVARRRLDGVRTAAEEGRDVAVLDDGFQHRRLARDLDLVLLSPSHPFPPRVLPRGPYREPLGALRRAHLLLVTWKGEEERRDGRDLLEVLRRIPGLPPAHLLGLRSGRWADLDGERAPPPEGSVLVLSSVARPGSVEALIREAGVSHMDVMAFPDHHPYRAEDVTKILRRAGGRTVVTTEKDAVKLLAFRERLPSVRVLPLEVAPGQALSQVEDALDRVLDGAAPGPTP
jgi:tetraacyldisaccharide 4'-kinase